MSRMNSMPNFDIRISVYRMAAGGSPSTEPKLPWPSISEVAHGEILGHASGRIVDGRISVRVILTHDITDNARRLLVGLVVVVIDLVHRKEDAPVHGFEAVPHVGYGPPDYDAHRIVEIRKLYFVGNVYVLSPFKCPL